MNLKEYLQFSIMMIPTLLLLVAAAVTLAFPARSMGEEPTNIVLNLPEGGEAAAQDINIGPIIPVPDR